MEPKIPATVDEVKNAIMKTAHDTLDLLKKSEFYKAEPPPPPVEPPPAPASEGEAAIEGEPPAPPIEDPELAADGAASPPAPPAADPAMDPAAEGGDELSSMAAQMSDEELGHTLEVFLAEFEKRQASAEQAPASEQSPAPTEDPMAAEKSMKEEFASLAKSISGISEQVKGLNEKVGKIEAEQAEQLKKSKKIVDAPAQSNVQTLSKSDEPNPKEAEKPTERLSKSETIDFCLDQIRDGNGKHIDRNVIADLNLTKTDEELHKIQDSLSKKGVQFPK